MLCSPTHTSRGELSQAYEVTTDMTGGSALSMMQLKYLLLPQEPCIHFICMYLLHLNVLLCLDIVNQDVSNSNI